MSYTVYHSTNQGITSDAVKINWRPGKKIPGIPGIRVNYKENRRERIYQEGYLYAENLLNQYCGKYRFNPDHLKNGHRRTCEIHNIHMEMILLLRKNTEWTFQQIADYFHISRVYAQSLYKKISSSY